MESIPCPDHCPALGTPISFEQGAGHRPPENTASYDQIIPGNGYVVNNVVVISKRANMMKQDSTPDQLLRFADFLFGLREENGLLPVEGLGVTGVSMAASAVYSIMAGLNGDGVVGASLA